MYCFLKPVSSERSAGFLLTINERIYYATIEVLHRSGTYVRRELGFASSVK